MPDEMFFSNDERSLVRGNRIAKRTDTCRPCLVQRADSIAAPLQGVVLDVTPFGMLVRTVEPLEPGTRIFVQLMRDETFRHPLAPPQAGRVVRRDDIDGEFSDLGIELRRAPADPERPAQSPPRPRAARRLNVLVDGAVDLPGR